MYRLKRVLAYFVDLQIIMLSSYVLSYFLYPLLPVKYSFVVVYLLYYLIFDIVVREFSPGKILLGIVLVDRRTLGKPTLKAAVLRYVFRITPLFVLDILYFLLRKKRYSEEVTNVMVLYIT